MLIDIPDAGIILVSVLAFLSGLVTLYLYTRIRSSSTAKIAPTNLERMEFYEKEFIDMKIRLDVMELDGKNFTNPDLPRKNSKQVEKPEAMKQEFAAPKSKVATTLTCFNRAKACLPSTSVPTVTSSVETA